MKITWLLVVGFGLTLNFCSGFAGPLDNWHWRNPLPNGNPQSGPHTLHGIVFTNGQFVAVGDAGVVSISPDGTNWTESSTATTNKLNALVYGNGQFVAVGDGGAVETSADGTTWTLGNSGTTNSLGAVAFGNGRYVAVGSSVVIASANGVNWSPAVTGLSGASGVAGGGSGFVAVDGSPQAYFSSDGSAWTSQTLTAPGSVFSGAQLDNALVTCVGGNYMIGSFRWASSMSADRFVFTSADGSHWTTNIVGNIFTGTFGFYYNFFMTGNGFVIAKGLANSVPFLQFSRDGANWATTNSIPEIWENISSVDAGAFGNGVYVIATSPNPASPKYPLPDIDVSMDGLNWTNVEHGPLPPTGPTSYTFTGIAFSNGLYVAAAGNSMARSTNDLTYAVVDSPPALSAVINFGSGFIGVGSGGYIYQSSDGLSWTQRNSATASNLRGITAGNGLLVAVGDNGAIQTSPTGVIWTTRISGTSLPLYGAACSNGVFVAVGQRGTVLTSPDGINWTGQDCGSLTNLLSATYGLAGFLAVGPGGTVLQSPDGINWSKQNSGTTATLEGVSFGSGYYLACGDNAVVVTSPDGTNWTSRAVGAAGGQNLYGCAFLTNRFDVVGASGTIIESDPVSPLFGFQIHRGSGQSDLTMLVALGCCFRVQACTNLAAPDWQDVATFSNAAAITQWTDSSTSCGQRFYRLISP